MDITPPSTPVGPQSITLKPPRRSKRQQDGLAGTRKSARKRQRRHGGAGKSALALFYLINPCVQYEVW